MRQEVSRRRMSVLWSTVSKAAADRSSNVKAAQETQLSLTNRATRPINAETENMPYLRNGHLNELC